jgi:sulfite oxidase
MVPGVPFAPFSIGEWIVRGVPGGLATTAIEQLGHNAMRILELSVVIGSVALAALASSASGAVLATLAFALSLGAGLADPRRPGPVAVLISSAAAGGAAWIVASWWSRRGDAPAPAEGISRRRVLTWIGAGAAGAALVQWGFVRRLGGRSSDKPVRADEPARWTRDASFAVVAGLTPRITSRRRHYTVDIDLDDPALDDGSWRLRVLGKTERSLELTLGDLRAMHTVEELDTLTCISNTIGGDLVSTARWTGVRLGDLVALAEPRPAATYVRVLAADGYDESYPIALASRPDVLVAFGMNGLPLPRSHGFPARLLLPGRFGMKNVKWLTAIELTSEAAEGYWVKRGWDAEAIVRTESRIDVPDPQRPVPPSFVAAGVAWAGDRGISQVELSTDDGKSWLPAQLEAPLGPLTWRRWQLRLQMPPGTHPLTVRATDGAGEVQNERREPPHPSGATGWHRIQVTVR